MVNKHKINKELIKYIQKLFKMVYKYQIYVISGIITIVCVISIFLQNNIAVIVNMKNDLNSKAKSNVSRVYVSGEVKNEGVFELKNNSTAGEAISSAGGITDNADITNVQSDRILKDGDKILVPSKKMSEEYPEGGESVSVSNINDKVNINTASKDELMELDGIGDITAKKIIEYRESNGDFSDISQIKDVNGIGESKFEKIMGKICTE